VVDVLKITERQFAAFQAQELQRFRDDVAQTLRDSFPAEFGRKSAADLYRLIDWGITKARAYGIEMEAEIARFIELVGPHGEDFDRKPGTVWMESILCRTDAPAADRLDAILERLAFADA